MSNDVKKAVGWLLPGILPTERAELPLKAKIYMSFKKWFATPSDAILKGRRFLKPSVCIF